ncbi:MAG: hypothetical protein EOP56_16770 [Sphingobacteriales bacterium]|nr:MAG: hypothetical protein EOP56_16770 [Sphingobacteriales bacterium]
MKLRLLPLSILLVASLAACKKDPPSATIGLNPNAPKPIDSNFKVSNNKWNWGGVAPFSYKMNGKLIETDQNMTYQNTRVSLDGSTFYSIFAVTPGSGQSDIIVSFNLPDKISDMLVGQEYSIPTKNGSAQFTSPTYDPVDPEVKTSFAFWTSEGGNMAVKITSITATEIEGKFYGVLKQRSDMKSNSGLDWVKIEEGYFKFDRNDTTAVF